MCFYLLNREKHINSCLYNSTFLLRAIEVHLYKTFLDMEFEFFSPLFPDLLLP